MKKKKVLIIIAVIIALLAGGIVYAYFATDLFKTDKEIFLSYLGKEETWENFSSEKELDQYFEKMSNTPFKQNGEISLKVEGDDESSLENINNSTIKLEGKVDNKRKKLEEKVTIQTSVGVDIPVTIKRDDDTYGIYSKLLNDKYIAIRNENLKELAEKLEINPENVPDKIEIFGTKPTKEDIKTIKNDLSKVFEEKLTDEMFTSEYIDDSEVITLKITDAQIFDLIKGICEELKDNETVQKLIAKDMYDQYQSIMSDIINSIDKEDKSDDIIEMKLYIKAKKVTKLEMVDQETKEAIVLENIENKTTIKFKDEDEVYVEFIIEKTKSTDSLVYTYTMKGYSNSDVEEASIIVTYKNIKDINNIESTVSIKVDGINPVEMYERNDYSDSEYDDTGDFLLDEDIINSSYDNSFKFEMNINNKTEFDESITFDEFNTDNSIIINDASIEEIEEILSNIYQNEF